jgi:hypothetical protein
MMPHEDIAFQLVDLPAISPEHPVPWLASTRQTADAVLLVVDLGDPACVERSEAMQTVLHEWRVTLSHRCEPVGESARVAAPGGDDPFALRLPTLLVANKAGGLRRRRGRRGGGVPRGHGASLPRPGRIGNHRAGPGGNWPLAVQPPRYRTRLHEGPGSRPRQDRPATWSDRGRGRAPRARGSRTLA